MSPQEEFNILPLGHPRPPTKNEKTKLFLYLLKLKYGTLDGLTEEQRLGARVAVDSGYLAVFDNIKSYEVLDEKNKSGREYSQIVFAMWIENYQPDWPFYYDVFAFWKDGKEIHQLTPESGFLQLEEDTN